LSEIVSGIRRSLLQRQGKKRRSEFRNCPECRALALELRNMEASLSEAKKARALYILQQAQNLDAN